MTEPRDEASAGEVTRAGEASQAAASHQRAWARRYVLLGVVALGSGIGVSLLLDLVDHPAQQTHWGSIAAVVAVAVAVFAVVGRVVWRRQTTASGPVRDLFRLGTPRSNRRVFRALRRGRPVDAADRRIAEAMVEFYRRRRRTAWLPLGLGLVWLAISLAFGHGLQQWLGITLGMVYLGLALYWQLTRARLLRHAAEQGIASL